MAVRDGGAAALAPARAAVQPGHLGRGPGLVDEDQPLRIEIGLSLEPGRGAGAHVRSVLLAGVRGLFLTRHAVALEEPPNHAGQRPVAHRASSRSAISASVMSGFSSTSPGSGPGAHRSGASACCPRLAGSRPPPARTRETQRIAVETPTPNRPAAARRDDPASTASTTRRRRSTERGLLMRLASFTSPHVKSDARPLWESGGFCEVAGHGGRGWTGSRPH